MLKQFYEKVLPSQGVYCLTVIGTDKQAYNRFAESLDALINLIEDLKQDRQNIFVAPPPSRTSAAWQRMPCT